MKTITLSSVLTSDDVKFIVNEDMSDAEAQKILTILQAKWSTGEDVKNLIEDAAKKLKDFA